MHGLIQEIIHAVNLSRDEVLTQEEKSTYSERYDEIVKKSGKEKEQPFFSQHTI